MLDMINREDNHDVIGHGEGTAKPVVKMENTLKEAAEPSHSEEVYIAVTIGGLGTSSGKSPSYNIQMVSE